MEDSHVVLQKAIEKVGVKQVAADLSLSTALVYKWCQDTPSGDKGGNPSGSRNPLDRIEQVYKSTGDLQLINWICQIADGHFVRNAKPELLGDQKNIVSTTQRLIHEFSETLSVISAAYAKDKRINPKEAVMIRKEWEDLKRIGEGFVKSCESGHFNHTDQ